MSAPLGSRPADDGFAMPAEWAPHAGCWMAWPERPDTWRRAAGPAQEAFGAVAAAIVEVEPVTVAASAAQLERARRLLPAAVEVVELETNDAWMRDIGPTVVVDDRGRRRGVDWVFNAWGGDRGGLYSPWDADDRAAAAVLDHEHLDRYRAPLVLEGGAIHVDGEGTLLTTEECLLNPNRNPTLDRGQIERHLRAHTGAETIIWLGAGVFEDETDGHVDNLACFVRPGVVALTWCDDPADPQHTISLDARRRLEAATDHRGRSLEVHLLPQPGPLHLTDDEAAGIAAGPGAKHRRGGARLAASYVNFYLANGRVVMPRLDERTDAAAQETLQGLFPDRDVVGVATREVLLGGGNIHCITQQIPRGGPTDRAT